MSFKIKAVKFGKFERNPRGYHKLLTGQAARRLIDRSAEELAKAAGPTYEAHKAPSTTRARATIYTEDWDTKVADNRDQILLGAVGKVKR